MRKNTVKTAFITVNNQVWTEWDSLLGEDAFTTEEEVKDFLLAADTENHDFENLLNSEPLNIEYSWGNEIVISFKWER